MFQQSSLYPSKVLKYLILANVVIYVVDALANGVLQNLLGLNTYLVWNRGDAWRLIGYLFSHDLKSPFHILFNMLMLWMFGAQVLQDLGSRKFLWFYFLTGFFAGLVSLFFDVLTGGYTIYIGASGSILGLLVFYACMYPNREVLVWGLFPIRVKWLVAIIVAMDVLFFGRNQIANITHLGGVFFGFLYFFLYHQRERTLQWWRNWKQHQKSKNTLHLDQKSQAIMKDVDHILEKISKEGMSSLSFQEKRILKQASKIKKEQKEKTVPFPPRKGFLNYPE
jgi:membrane associated rhomboid family serine protease